MLQALKKLNQRWQKQGIVGENGVEPVRFRCGIHQGTVFFFLEVMASRPVLPLYLLQWAKEDLAIFKF